MFTPTLLRLSYLAFLPVVCIGPEVLLLEVDVVGRQMGQLGECPVEDAGVNLLVQEDEFTERPTHSPRLPLTDHMNTETGMEEIIT